MAGCPFEHEQRSSHHTVASFRRDLSAFLTFLNQHLGALPSLASLRALTRSDLRAYLDRTRRELMPGSTARPLAVLRNFFAFLAHQGLVNNAVFLQAHKPKVPNSVQGAQPRRGPRRTSVGDLSRKTEAE